MVLRARKVLLEAREIKESKARQALMRAPCLRRRRPRALPLPPVKRLLQPGLHWSPQVQLLLL